MMKITKLADRSNISIPKRIRPKRCHHQSRMLPPVYAVVETKEAVSISLDGSKRRVFIEKAIFYCELHTPS